jgi:hypothetical protein
VLTTIPPPRPEILDPITETMLKTTTAARLQGFRFPPLTFYVEGLVPEGLTLLVGSPKIGKSWLSLSLAISVASGSRALGGQVPTTKCDVLLLALEDGPRRLQDRMRLLVGSDPWPSSLHFAVDRPEGDVRHALDDHMEAFPRTRFVVLDTLAKVRPPMRTGESMYGDDYRFVGGLQKWAVDRRVGLLCLHHDRKAEATDFVETVSGSHGITGAADAIIVLSRARGDDEGQLQITGRDLADDKVWKLKRSGPDWHFVEKAPVGLLSAIAGLGDRSADVASYVVKAGKPVGAIEVALALGLDRGQVDLALKRLTDSGRIIRVARGKYGSPRTTPLQEVQEVQEVIPLNPSLLAHLSPPTDTEEDSNE